MSRILLVLFAILLSACGKDGGSSSGGESCGSKALFSQWSYISQGNPIVLDLTGIVLNKPFLYQVVAGGGETCQMELTFTGTECTGVETVANSTYTGGGAGDPGCVNFNGTETYTKSSSGLTLCENGNCYTLQ